MSVCLSATASTGSGNWYDLMDLFLYPFICLCVGSQVCAFSVETDVDMRGKVMIRMKDITDVQKLLESCMAGQTNPHPLGH